MLGNQTTNALGTYDFTQMDLVQLNKPSEGQDVAVIETNLGTITAVLYAEFAPKTVANFKKRALRTNARSTFGRSRAHF